MEFALAQLHDLQEKYTDITRENMDLKSKYTDLKERNLSLERELRKQVENSKVVMKAVAGVCFQFY